MCAAEASEKSAVRSAPVGQIAWFDISSSNLQQSKDFYGKLFNWTFKPVPGTSVVVEIASDGTSIGTLRPADGTISASNGVVYVMVSDIQASCKKAQDLGAKVPDGFPFNLSAGRGSIALAIDPSGHPIGMYSQTAV